MRRQIFCGIYVCGIGNGENHDSETPLIPLFLDAAGGQRPDIKVFGTDYDTPDGSCIRDYIHVYDLAVALPFLYIKVIKKLDEIVFY